MQQTWSASVHRACGLLQLSRTVYKYETRRYDQAPLRARIKEIAYARVRYGCERIHVILRREGWHVNHKRTYRLYCLEGLNLRYRRPRRHKSSTGRIQRLPAQRVNQCWSMDFVADNLFNGSRIRFLTVVDVYTRECLTIEVGQGLRGEDVVHTMGKITKQRGSPEQIFVDNGSEFISKVLAKWAYEQGVTLAFSRPGKPTDNAFIESFNGSFRDECLNTHWFLSLDDAQIKAENWRQDYNTWRPHSALNYQTPAAFAAQSQTC